MALKKTTKLKRSLQKRTAMIESSTRQLLDDMSEVVDGADIFFKETMPQHNIRVMWQDMDLTENDEVIIKGVMSANNEQFHAANVMVIRIPLEMAALSDARTIADFMIKQAEKHKAATAQSIETATASAPTPATPAKVPETEFDLSKLSPEQKAALDLFTASRGGKL